MNAVIYARVSTSKQELEGTSLETQVIGCRQKAAEIGAPVSYVINEAKSGKDIYTREGITKLRELVRSNSVTHVIVYALDRLSRKQGQQFLLAEEMEHRGVHLVSVTEEIDNTAVGTFMRQARAFAAELEREKLIERSGRGRRARVELEGMLLPGRRPPFGYRWEDEIDENGRVRPKAKLRIDAVTGPIAERIFLELEKGTTASKLAQQLTSEGIPTPTGNSVWQPAAICQMVRNTVYYGEPRAFRYSAVDEDDNQSFPRADRGMKVSGNVCDPLVSFATWKAVDENLVNHKQFASRRSKFPEAALLRGGFVKCGYCGCTATATSQKNKAERQGLEHWIEYRCNPYQKRIHGCTGWAMYAPNLDEIVWNKVRTILTQPDYLLQQLEEHKEDDPTARDREALYARRDSIIKRQTNLKNRLPLIEDEDTANAVITDINQLGQQKRVIEDELATLEKRHQVWVQGQMHMASVESFCATFGDKMDSVLDYAEKREVLHALNLRVKMYAEDHNPRWEITCDIPLDDIDNGSSTSSIINAFTFLWTSND